MDIVTHAGLGLIAAAPLLDSHPELALGFVAGSVLPDLDAVSRLLGKRAYLRSHQTWSHALPVQVLISAVTGLLARACGIDGFLLGLGLFAGLAIHTLLDFSNTLGVTLLAPFSRRRFCLEWVFFIDAVVLLLTLIAGGLTIWSFWSNGEVSPRFAIAYFGALAVYVAAKAILRTRAGALAPDAISLIPSGLIPWRFLGVMEGGGRVQMFQLNAITGHRQTLSEQDVLDDDHVTILEHVPEFVLMRQLSPAYHVVSASGTDAGELILCRDLRTRNFGTTFGDLEVLLDSQRRVKQVHFHV